MQQFPPIKFAIPTRVASSFDHPDWIFKVEAAMPKQSRRWQAQGCAREMPSLLRILQKLLLLNRNPGGWLGFKPVHVPTAHEFLRTIPIP